ncbi:MAG: hypothetical protein KKB85_00575 [Candidatus Altiarchaeota archaeon]|nr:hypothetical protein [Candidatus Altiarchaeota archaeon]
MKPLKSVISRVRWNVVLAIIAAILIVALAAVVLVTIKPLDSGYKGEEDIRIKSWAEPSTVKLNDESKIWVNIKNEGSKTYTVHIKLKSPERTLIFTNTTNQTIEQEIKIEPKGERSPEFPIEIDTNLIGRYVVTVTVSYDHSEIEDEVILNVRRG